MDSLVERQAVAVHTVVAFEAVMRAGSVTAAARDLDLTQSTVSRLVRALEDQLGRNLFVRFNRKLVPNEAAESYLRDVTRLLDTLQRSSTRLVTNAQGASLSLATSPSFGTRWLAPRLGCFLNQNPGILVNFATRIDRSSRSEFARRDDLFRQTRLIPNRPIKLFDEYTACAAPSFLDRHATRGSKHKAARGPRPRGC